MGYVCTSLISHGWYTELATSDCDLTDLDLCYSTSNALRRGKWVLDLLKGANRGDNAVYIMKALCGYVVRAASVRVEALCTSC